MLACIKKTTSWAALGLALTVWAFPAQAQQESGPVVGWGVQQESFKTSVENYWGNGLTLRLGFQISLGPVALVPMVQGAWSGSGAKGIWGQSSTLSAIEGRLWLDKLYLGARVGYYTQYVQGGSDCNCLFPSLAGGSRVLGGSGDGTGASLGWVLKSGTVVSLEVDQATQDYKEYDVAGNVTGQGQGKYAKAQLMFTSLF